MYFLRHSADIDILPASKTMFLKDTGIGGSTSGQWICTARRSSWISLLSTESPAVAAMEPIAAAIAAWVVNLSPVTLGSWNHKFNVWHSADVASALMTDLFLSGEFYWCLVPSTLWSFFIWKIIEKSNWEPKTFGFSWSFIHSKTAGVSEPSMQIPEVSGQRLGRIEEFSQQRYSRWWCHIFLSFTPIPWEMIQFDWYLWYVFKATN